MAAAAGQPRLLFTKCENEFAARILVVELFEMQSNAGVCRCVVVEECLVVRCFTGLKYWLMVGVVTESVQCAIQTVSSGTSKTNAEDLALMGGVAV